MDVSSRMRLPPQSLDAELSLIGAAMLAPDRIDHVRTQVSSEDFYSEAHRLIWESVLSLCDAGHKVDAVTLYQALQSRQQLEKSGGDEYLMQVMASVPHAAHINDYARIVFSTAVKRRLYYHSMKTITQIFESTDTTDELIDRAESGLHQLASDRRATHTVAISDVLVDSFSRLESRRQQSGPSGLLTALSDFDQLLGGLARTELHILAARPSMGKTALVCNVASDAAASGKTVLFFSLEQPLHELTDRVLCMRSGVNSHLFRNGDLDESEIEQLMYAASEMDDKDSFPFYIEDGSDLSVSKIKRKCLALQKRRGLDLVVIDYLQLIAPEDRRIPREQQIATVSRRLKFLARDLDVPVVCLAQINRESEKAMRPPRLSDLRESGAIEQDADVVIFLHRPEQLSEDQLNPDRPGEADLIIGKNRNGPTGKVTVTWVKESMRFLDFAGRHMEKAIKDSAVLAAQMC